MTASEIRRWLARFDAVAEIDRRQRPTITPTGDWAFRVALPLIDAARVALDSAPALQAYRASEDAVVRAIWKRRRDRLRP